MKERGKGLRRTGIRRAAAAAPGPGRGGRVPPEGMAWPSRPETVHSEVMISLDTYRSAGAGPAGRSVSRARNGQKLPEIARNDQGMSIRVVYSQ